MLGSRVGVNNYSILEPTHRNLTRLPHPAGPRTRRFSFFPSFFPPPPRTFMPVAAPPLTQQIAVDLFCHRRPPPPPPPIPLPCDSSRCHRPHPTFTAPRHSDPAARARLQVPSSGRQPIWPPPTRLPYAADSSPLLGLFDEDANPPHRDSGLLTLHRPVHPAAVVGDPTST
jgi:hypothetical protein